MAPLKDSAPSIPHFYWNLLDFVEGV